MTAGVLAESSVQGLVRAELAYQRRRFEESRAAYDRFHTKIIPQSQVSTSVLQAVEWSAAVSCAALGVPRFQVDYFKRISSADYLAASPGERLTMESRGTNPMGQAIRAEHRVLICADLGTYDAAATVFHEARHLIQAGTNAPEADEQDALAFEGRAEALIVGWMADQERRREESHENAA